MKKHNKKIVIGWILIILQLIALIGRLLSGIPFPTGVLGFFNIIGFFSFSIVGAILLFLGYKSNKHNKREQEPNTQATTIKETPSKIKETSSDKRIPYKKYLYIIMGVLLTAIIILLVVMIVNISPRETNQESFIDCSVCRGTGNITCSSCRGTGKQTCSTCRGSSIAKCPHCPECPWCDGNGVRIVNGNLILCGHCVSGKMDCSVCSNTRKIKCYNCNGGITICDKCSNGKKTCNSCKGTGKVKNNLSYSLLSNANLRGLKNYPVGSLTIMRRSKNVIT